MKLKKVLSLVLCAAMITGMTAGCGSTKDDSSSDKGEVYYLSFKPELTKQWEDIAKKYEQKTGVKVKVVTAASGQYEQTLKSEIAKKDAPTLFQINGPVGYQKWKDYSRRRFNFGGYVNLPYTVVWGAAALLCIWIVNPFLSKIIGILPYGLGKVILIIAYVVIVIDELIYF